MLLAAIDCERNIIPYKKRKKSQKYLIFAISGNHLCLSICCLAIISFLVLMPHCVEAQSPTQINIDHKFSNYESKRLGISIDHPRWITKETDNQLYFRKPHVLHTKFDENVLIGSFAAGNMNLPEIVSQNVNYQRLTIPGFKIINSKTIDPIDNNIAYEITYNFTKNLANNPQQLTATQIYMIKNNNLYIITYEAEPSKHQISLPIFQEMIRSLKVRPANNFYKFDRYGINVGIMPTSLASDPNTNTIYVANLRSNSVSVINGFTDTVVKNIMVGNSPTSVAVNPNTEKIYVANRDSNTVSVIDGSTKNVVTNITVGSSPNAIAVDPQEGWIFVTNLHSNSVSVINGFTDTVVKNIMVGNSPTSVAVNQLLHILYIASNSMISMVDYVTSNNGGFDIKTRNTTPIGILHQGSCFNTPTSEVSPSIIAVDSKTNKIYLINQNSDIVSIIDGFIEKPVANISSFCSPASITLDPNRSMIYVINRDNNTISAINESTNQIVRNIVVGKSPTGLTINPTSRKIYVANSRSNSDSVINGSNSQYLPIERIYFNIHPINAGALVCNGKTIQKSAYIVYNNKTHIRCNAFASKDYVFNLWSANPNIQLNISRTVLKPSGSYFFSQFSDSSSPSIEFTTSKYETLTANFEKPSNPLKDLGNLISIISMVILLILPMSFVITSPIATNSKKPRFFLLGIHLPSLFNLGSADTIQTCGAVIAGALILLTLTTSNIVGGIDKHQITFITEIGRAHV